MRLFFTISIFTILPILTVLLCIPAMASEQKNIAFIKAFERIEKINSARPGQSARHKQSTKVLTRRILDKTNRVVGKVNDVILDRNGSISSLNVNFDRLRLGTDTLVVNYHDLGMQTVSNGYKTKYTDDQIKDMVPDLLAGIQTASGKNASQYSLKKLIGQKITMQNGQAVGKIQDILFDSKGSRAEFLFVNVNYQSLRGERVAIPFTAANYSNNKIIVSDDFANAMIEYIKEN